MLLSGAHSWAGHRGGASWARGQILVPLFLLLVTIASDSVLCDDLSTTCPRHGRVLQGHGLSTHSEWSPLACAGLCSRSPACESYSFCPAAERCHLHDSTAEQYAGDLVDSPDCVHYRMARQPRNTQHQSWSKNVACNPAPFELRTPASRFDYRFALPQFLHDREVFLMMFSVRCSGSGFITIGPDHGQVSGNYYTITLGPRTRPLFYYKRMSNFRLSTLHYGRMSTPLSSTKYQHYWLAYVRGNILMGQRGRPPFLDKKDSGLRFTPSWPSLASDKGCDWVFHSMANLQLCRVCGGS